jgi:hypothetical protein
MERLLQFVKKKTYEQCQQALDFFNNKKIVKRFINEIFLLYLLITKRNY